MIRYGLRCSRGHDFDAWFSGSGAFEKQRAAGLVECPVCGDVRVEKRLMRPAIPARANRQAQEGECASRREEMTGEDARRLRRMVRRLHALVRERAEYVGRDFPQEARRRHAAGEAGGERPVWGEASPEEARELVEEGIDILPLPPLPDKKN